MPSCPASSRWHCWLSSKAAHWALFQAAASQSCQELWFFLTPFMEARSVIFPFPHFKPCCRGLAATSVGLHKSRESSSTWAACMWGRS